MFVQHLAGGFRTGNRKHSRIEDADLFQGRALVPVDVLMADLVAAEFDDQDRCQFYVFWVGSISGKYRSSTWSCLKRTTSSSTTRSGPRVCDTVTLLRSVEFCSTK